MRTKSSTLGSVFLGWLLTLAAVTRGENVTYTFTGTGLHGSVAWGKFTTAVVTEPEYYASGSIYSAFSLTISNIPGNSPGSVIFLKAELELYSAFTITGGVPSILPQGGHDFGPPFYDHYDLGGGASVGQSVLTYDRAYRDDIIWSGLTIVSPPSPPVLAAKADNFSNLIDVSWTTNALSFQLEETASLAPPTWMFVTNEPTVSAGNFHVVLPKSGTGEHFFRLEWMGQ